MEVEKTRTVKGLKMKRSEMTNSDLLQLNASEPLDFLEVERQAHKMRAEVLAGGMSALARAVARMLGYGRTSGPREASL